MKIYNYRLSKLTLVFTFHLRFLLPVANKALSQLEAAEEEIMLSDADGDDAAKFLLGDCFMSVTEDYVNEKLESMKDGKQEEIDALQKRLDGIAARQKVLKDLLYQRFGNSINLDQ